MEEWVKLPLGMIDWRGNGDLNTTLVFLSLLLSADRESGMVETSLSRLSMATGLTVMNVRTSLAKLEKRGEIRRETDMKSSSITILKFADYLCLNEPLTKPLTKSLTKSTDSVSETYAMSPHSDQQSDQQSEPKTAESASEEGNQGYPESIGNQPFTDAPENPLTKSLTKSTDLDTESYTMPPQSDQQSEKEKREKTETKEKESNKEKERKEKKEKKEIYISASENFCDSPGYQIPLFFVSSMERAAMNFDPDLIAKFKRKKMAETLEVVRINLRKEGLVFEDGEVERFLDYYCEHNPGSERIKAEEYTTFNLFYKAKAWLTNNLNRNRQTSQMPKRVTPLLRSLDQLI